MPVILILYTLLNIMVFGFVVLFARATRARTAPNERVDLEDNSIIAEEWDLIRREQCGPHRCPRAVGNPPRPRKDVTCEICAALFMERYWQSRLSGVASADPGGGARAAREAGAAPMGLAGPSLVSLDAEIPDRVLARRGRDQRASRQIARARVLYSLGFPSVIIGAAIGLFTAFLIPGYLLVATGIALLIAAALSV